MDFRMNSPEGKAILALAREGDYAHPGEEEAIVRVAGRLPQASIHRVLDVGCGRGGTAHWFHKQGWGKVVGIDIDATSIAYAQRSYPGVDFIRCGAEELSRLSTDPFDLAYLFSSFYAFSDQEASLREIRKVCNAGAHLVMFDYTQPEDSRPPTILGREIGRPVVLSILGAWLRAAQWEAMAVTDLSLDFVRWYKDLLRRFEEKHPEITAKFGDSWYEFVVAWYGALHDALACGVLGGALVHATAAAG